MFEFLKKIVKPNPKTYSEKNWLFNYTPSEEEKQMVQEYLKNQKGEYRRKYG